VVVVLEYKTYNGYVKENIKAFKYLSENGVNVYLDNQSDTDHAKLVIIDDYIVYIGSHNWSESGLKYNHEVSARIVSKKAADELMEYFHNKLLPLD